MNSWMTEHPWWTLGIFYAILLAIDSLLARQFRRKAPPPEW